ncbi:MAG: hypothetical protein AB1635_20295 [Acidobacteriota bacterium]
MGRWLGSLGLALVTVATLTGQEPRIYGGIVIDGITGGGLAASLVTAYKDAATRTDKGPCPEFGTRESATTASPGGQFLLPVPPAVTTFAAVYCRAGFFPRVEPVNPQPATAGGAGGGTRVAGDPVDLVPLTATPEQVRAALERHVERLRASVRYYESSAGPENQRVPWEAALSELRRADPDAAQMIDLARKPRPGR